jgi:hypothetical protein
VLNRALNRAKLDRSERISALKRLAAFAHGADLEARGGSGRAGAAATIAP